MIVKLWPVHGNRGLDSCVDYVKDDCKVTSISYDENGEPIRETFEVNDNNEDFFDYLDEHDTFESIFKYVENGEKTDGRKFVSGVNCNPNYASEQFRETMEFWADKGKNIKDDDVTCYHLVQSFPEGISISNEEVHECGIELMRKLEGYQGIVCTHVHPVVDEKGEVHGKQKHNHIVFCAYKMPEYFDELHPNRRKFHRTMEAYEQLQEWNDLIALDHGLPIVSSIEPEKIYDWEGLPDSKINRANRWLERMRTDIRQAKKSTKELASFVEKLSNMGYEVKKYSKSENGKTRTGLSFKAPDGKHKARSGALGDEFFVDELTNFWVIRDELNRNLERAIIENKPAPLEYIYDTCDHNLFVTVSIGKGEKKASVPLYPSGRDDEVIRSYIDETEMYDVTDVFGNRVYTTSGTEIIDMMLKKEREYLEDPAIKCRREEEEEKKKRLEELKKEQEKQDAYYRRAGRFSENPYSVFKYNEDGTEKGIVELSLILGQLLICEDLGLENYVVQQAVKISDNELARRKTFDAKIDKRIQVLSDSIVTMRRHNIRSEDELTKAVIECGKELNKAKKAVSRTQERIEKSEDLRAAIHDYEAYKSVGDAVQTFSDEEEKNDFLKQNNDAYQKFTAALHTMYAYKTRPEQINDFKQRYEKWQRDLSELQEKLNANKENMRQLKRAQWAYQMSKDADYLIKDPEKNEKSIVANREFTKERDTNKEREAER